MAFCAKRVAHGNGEALKRLYVETSEEPCNHEDQEPDANSEIERAPVVAAEVVVAALAVTPVTILSCKGAVSTAVDALVAAVVVLELSILLKRLATALSVVVAPVIRVVVTGLLGEAMLVAFAET